MEVSIIFHWRSNRIAFCFDIKHEANGIKRIDRPAIGCEFLAHRPVATIHAFSEDLVYIRAKFPMGKTGLRLKNGTITPTGPELDHLVALWGPAAKPGDRARISDVVQHAVLEGLLKTLKVSAGAKILAGAGKRMRLTRLFHIPSASPAPHNAESGPGAKLGPGAP